MLVKMMILYVHTQGNFLAYGYCLRRLIIDAIQEGGGERIIRCGRYLFPLFKCSDRKNYSVEAFNMLFEYEYAH